MGFNQKVGVGSKIMCFPDILPCHPTRPLVSVVQVKGFGGKKRFPTLEKTFQNVSKKTFSVSAISLIHPLCSPTEVDGAGHRHIHRLLHGPLTEKVIWSLEVKSWLHFHWKKKCVSILAKQHSQILLEFRIHQAASLSEVEASSSSPHRTKKPFAFY